MSSSATPTMRRRSGRWRQSGAALCSAKCCALLQGCSLVPTACLLCTASCTTGAWVRGDAILGPQGWPHPMTETGLVRTLLLTHCLPRPYLGLVISAQIGDLPAMRDIIPHHDPQDVGTDKGVGARRDDHRLVQVRGGERGKIRSGAGLDRLGILHLHLPCLGPPGHQLLCSPTASAFSGISITHAKLLRPPIAGPQLRLAAQGLDDRIHHPIHVPEQPGNGVTLAGGLPGKGGLIETL